MTAVFPASVSFPSSVKSETTGQPVPSLVLRAVIALDTNGDPIRDPDGSIAIDDLVVENPA
jgi:hypothetical protein